MTTSFWRWWGPLVLYMALIFFLSSRPRPTTLNETPDVWLHGGAYFVMALLAIRALARGLLEPVSAAVIAGGVAIAVVYGAVDELHQTFVPERVGSWLDLLYDTGGAVLAGLAVYGFGSFRGGPK